MKYVYLIIATGLIGLIFSCHKNGDGEYPYCVECPDSAPGDSVQCFSTEDYAMQYLESKSYLPDSNSCKLISE
ncbi:MAG: hypothetical protein WD048_10085 [Chitinophagales bacterium]